MDHADPTVQTGCMSLVTGSDRGNSPQLDLDQSEQSYTATSPHLKAVCRGGDESGFDYGLCMILSINIHLCHAVALRTGEKRLANFRERCHTRAGCRRLKLVFVDDLRLGHTCLQATSHSTSLLADHEREHAEGSSGAFDFNGAHCAYHRRWWTL